MPDEDREWKLNYEKRKRSGNLESVAVRQCLKCYKVYKGTNPICPYCGNNNGKTKEQIKEEQEAELEKIKKIEKYQRKNEIWNCKTYAQLIAYAKEHKYSNPGGWAYYILQARKKKGKK